MDVIILSSVTRIYWSTKTPNQRCVYTCRVVRVDTQLAESSSLTPISDTTIVHDADVEGYTPPELLTTRYPEVFNPATFGMFCLSVIYVVLYLILLVYTDM